EWLPHPHRQAPTRPRRSAARPEPVRAGDPDRQDRRPGPLREDSQAVLGLLEAAGRTSGALWEDDQHVPVVQDALGEPERLDVRGAAIDRMDGAGPRQLAEDRPIDHLALA